MKERPRIVPAPGPNEAPEEFPEVPPGESLYNPKHWKKPATSKDKQQNRKEKKQ